MNIDHKTKENILNAAKAEFALCGFSGARLAVIAENLGVNKALIHYYFKSKDLLYESVWESFFAWDDDFEDVPIYFQDHSFSIPEKLYLYIYITINLAIRLIDTKILDIFLWELAEGGEFLKKFNEKFFVDKHRIFNLILEAGHKEKLFDLKYANMIDLGMRSVNLIYNIEQKRHEQKQCFCEILHKEQKEREENFFNYMIDYVFRMLAPVGKTIPIPKIKPEIFKYIDKLLGIHSNKISIPISKRILDSLCSDLIK